jgi:hypothetical protein
MEIVISVLAGTAFGLIVGGLAAGFYLKKIREASSEDEQIQKLENDLNVKKDRVLELETKGRENFAHLQKAEASVQTLQQKNEGLNKELTTYKAKEERMQDEHERKIQEAFEMKKSFEEEKLRIQNEADMKKQHDDEERDRIWAEHENVVISLLTGLCKQPQYAFQSFDNKNPPPGFHGNLKPDFMIEFLDQIVIFDAKASKAKSLQNYISDAVKTTAKKVEGNEKIYPTIFLVVPSHAISELKNTSFYEGGLSFHVISPEAIAPILACFKKIEAYEFADAWDPQERENIIDLIANFHAHIATRNAFDYLIIEEGINALKKTESLDPKMLEEASIKSTKIRSVNLNTAEQKSLRASPELLKQKLRELTSPKPELSAEELKKMKV